MRYFDPVKYKSIALALVWTVGIVMYPLGEVRAAAVTTATTSGTPGSAHHGTEDLIKRILLDEISLARFNVHYRQNAARQGRWKGLRYFLFQEANSGLTEASLIVGVSERMSHIRGDHFKQLHQGALEHGNVLGAVGQVIGGSGSMIEYMINGYHAIKASRDGFSPASAKRYITDLAKKIDGEISELRPKVEGDQPFVSGDTLRVRALEVSILGDIRDLLVNEFDSFHIGARRSLWMQQSYYLLDTAKNATGAVANLYGYKALRQHNRQFNQPAGVLNTVSGALIVLNPILSRLIGRCMSAVDRHGLERSGLRKVDSAMEHLNADYDELKTLCENGKDSGDAGIMAAIGRADIYESHQQHFTKQLEKSSKELRSGNRIAVQNILSAMFVGGTKVSYGIQFMNAGFKYVNNPRMTNVMLGTGPIAYLAGTSYSLIDNLRIQVLREIHNIELSKKHQLPGQLLDDQIEQLDRLEASINLL